MSSFTPVVLRHIARATHASRLGAAALLGAALAQPAAAQETPTAADANCRSQVSRFEQAIAFVRDAQGVEAAGRLKEQLLPAKLESELLMAGGYCQLARHLRDKRLL
ncbi:hypothetical protein [Ideonella livida]|uniref:Uncharacterized protein n=1 Tax=Ideonella livida TaxID=2707176 RepID=A0A7C9TLX4_9BURK|nr:hypothetical protein [Ideonella livida]NDY92325.1 hypothetical protein [Ideonella livida]